MGFVNDYLLKRNVLENQLEILNENFIGGYEDVEFGDFEVLREVSRLGDI